MSQSPEGRQPEVTEEGSSLARARAAILLAETTFDTLIKQGYVDPRKPIKENDINS